MRIKLKISQSSTNAEVAETILKQIRALDRNALMAWGAKEFVSLGDAVLEKVEYGQGIKFKVNGSKHKGYILIHLTPNDEYNIFAFSIRSANIKVKNTVRGVMAYDLVSTLDTIIG